MKLFSMILLLLLSASSFAEVAGYDVEIIIFEDRAKRYAYTESWPEHESLQVVPADISLQKKTFGLLRSKDYRLNDYRDKLSSNPDYKVLYHISWRQPGLDEENAVPFYINSEAGKSAQADGNADRQSIIKGNITLVLSRFLHLNTDLIYLQPKENEVATSNNTAQAPVTPGPISPYQSFSIKSERRMRSKEVHYIDHPLVGILALATPYEAPETSGN